jgi:uncharacterized RmlC-like cupin family protein
VAFAREAGDTVPDEEAQQAERSLLDIMRDVLLSVQWDHGDLAWCQSSIVPRRASDDTEEEQGENAVSGITDAQIGWRILATSFIDAEATGDAGSLDERIKETLQDVLDATGEARMLEVEEWVTCPCCLPLVEVDTGTLNTRLHLGALGTDDERTMACEVLLEEGVCVLSAALPRTLAEELRVTTKGLIELADTALRAKGIDVGTQAFTFADISSRGNFRFDLKFDTSGGDGAASCAAANRLLEDGPWVPLVLQLLGATAQEVVRRADLIYSRPGSPHQEWHSDGPHYGPGADERGLGEPPPYAICVFVPLIDLTMETGCVFLPT